MDIVLEAIIKAQLKNMHQLMDVITEKTCVISLAHRRQYQFPHVNTKLGTLADIMKLIVVKLVTVRGWNPSLLQASFIKNGTNKVSVKLTDGGTVQESVLHVFDSFSFNS